MDSNIHNLFDLTGKVAIVSGGAQGLGEAIATNKRQGVDALPGVLNHHDLAEVAATIVKYRFE